MSAPPRAEGKDSSIRARETIPLDTFLDLWSSRVVTEQKSPMGLEGLVVLVALLLAASGL